MVSNTLDRQFEVDAPDKVWVTDITYIKTHEGWLFCLSSSTCSRGVWSDGRPSLA